MFSVVSADYDTYVNQATVLLHNDVVVSCEVPSHVADHVTVVSWHDSEGNVFTPRGTSSAAAAGNDECDANCR